MACKASKGLPAEEGVFHHTAQDLSLLEGLTGEGICAGRERILSANTHVC